MRIKTGDERVIVIRSKAEKLYENDKGGEQN